MLRPLLAKDRVRPVADTTEPMQTLLSRLPDLDSLTAGLTSALRTGGATTGSVMVLCREPYLRGTFTKEIVTCRFEDGSERRLLCKYEARTNHNCYGHRSGIAYEAKVYQHVLPAAQMSAPTFLGIHVEPDRRETWLILEYLDRSGRARRSATSMVAAARWIGRFHALNEGRLSSPALSFLTKYDAPYYLGWAGRTLLLAVELHDSFPWLPRLCQRFEECVDCLLKPPVTVIHGEYTPRNVLIRDGLVYPVDWESAAVAAGEIDLACHTQGWSTEIVRECELEYQRARWPHGSPSDFKQRLEAARLYMQFRWLGERPDWTTDESCRWRFYDLLATGERLGAI
jgi:hypothetical protein